MAYSLVSGRAKSVPSAHFATNIHGLDNCGRLWVPLGPKASAETIFVRSALCRVHVYRVTSLSFLTTPTRTLNEMRIPLEGRIQVRHGCFRRARVCWSLHSSPRLIGFIPGSITPAANMYFQAATSPSSSELLHTGHCALYFQRRKGSNRGSNRQKLLRKQ